jgi:hypothetical protein
MKYVWYVNIYEIRSYFNGSGAYTFMKLSVKDKYKNCIPHWACDVCVSFLYAVFAESILLLDKGHAVT